MSKRRPRNRPRRPPASRRGATQPRAHRLTFTKMHGLGNDFMVVDAISQPVVLTRELIRQLGDRNRGVGFDQLLVVAPPDSPDADFNYQIFNADGGEVEHCGNGARCLARYVLDRGLTARTPIRVKTRNRILELHSYPDGTIQVAMGNPDFAPAALPFVAEPAAQYQLQVAEPTEPSRQVEVTLQAVSMGNPHIVLTVDDCENAPVGTVGAALSVHSAFPQQVNAGFMEIVDRSTIRLRVFERGAGETQACGTGACAAVVCGIQAGELDTPVQVHLRGGELTIDWQGEGHPVLMTGPAATVFEGTVTLPLDQQASDTRPPSAR